MEGKFLGSAELIPSFVVVVVVIQDKLQEESDSREIPETGSEVILDEIMLFVLILAALLNYMKDFLEIISHYIFTLKLNKTRFLDL